MFARLFRGILGVFSPVTLQQNGDDWTLPAGKSANFFRVRLAE